jgi:hypothetical protein
MNDSLHKSMDDLQQGENMSTIGPTYPAHMIVGQAEVRLVADLAENANSRTIKSDQQRVEVAQEIEAAQAKFSSVNIVS